MSGKTESLTPSERLAKFEQAIDTYINSKSLNVVGFNLEAAEALNLTSEMLSTLTSEECLQRAYIIHAYANYLQDEHNQNLVKLNFAVDNIRRIVSVEIDNYGKYTKHDIKQQQIINENPFAEKLETIRKHAQARVDRLQEKVRDVRKIGEVMTELSKRKAYP
mgnify:CR=1 FL=1